jgi:hypothetical protein
MEKDDTNGEGEGIEWPSWDREKVEPNISAWMEDESVVAKKRKEEQMIMSDKRKEQEEMVVADNRKEEEEMTMAEKNEEEEEMVPAKKRKV